MEIKETKKASYYVLFVVLIVVLITAMTAIAFWFHIDSTSKKLKLTAEHYQDKSELSMKMWHIAGHRERLLQNMFMISDPFELDELQVAHMSLGGQFLSARSQLMAMRLSAVEEKDLSELNRTTLASANYQERISQLVVDEDLDQAYLLIRDSNYIDARSVMFKKFKDIFNYYRQQTIAALDDASSTILNEIKMVLILTALVLLSSVTVGYYMIRKVSNISRDLYDEATRRKAVQKQLENHQHVLEEKVEQAVIKYKNSEALQHESLNMAATFGEILETSLNEIYIFDAETFNFIQVNEGARKNLGYSMEELKKMTPFGIKPEFSEVQFKSYLQPLLSKTVERLVFTTAHQRKDDSIYPVEAHLQLSVLNDKPAFVAIIQDISVRQAQQTELENKKSEAEKITKELSLQKTALEKHAIVCVADKSGIIQSINDKYVEISGFAEDELLGGNFLIGLSEEQAEADILTISETTQDGDIWHGVLSMLRSNGESYWTKTTIVPFADKDEEIYKFVVISTDITEQKLNEKLLLQQSTEIIVANEALESSSRQIMQAEKLASVGLLAAGIAHEINTPIQFVGDNILFLRDACGDLLELVQLYETLHQDKTSEAEQSDLLGNVRKLSEKVEVDYLVEEMPSAFKQSLEGVERVSNIVRSMKDFSHPGSDQLEHVDINNAIESTINVSRNEWKYVAEMVTDFDKSLNGVPCYLGEFNQVVLNIIVNAAHAIKDANGDAESLGKIIISTRLDDEYAEIRIQDSGTGMPEEVRKHVFDPFFTTKVVGKGTGQGLAIAYRVIVEKHHGSIKVDSEPDKGTTFSIRLPMTAMNEKPANEILEQDTYVAGAM